MPAVTAHTLDNGLRVVLRPDPAVPVAGLALYYDVGSRNEERGRSGFAHLFEHMMFEGSAHVGKAEHFKLISSFGGQINATTSQDRTNYFESLPAHQLAVGLWLEADRMRALAVTPENFENQRQTVMEERKQRVDNAPYGQAMLRLTELSYANWAYSHPVIGSWEDLESAAYDDVLAFHRRWYRPDNAVLALAGDVDIDAALRAVDDLFGDIEPGGDRPAPDVFEPPRSGPVLETVTDPLAQLPAVFLNHPAPPLDHPDFFVWEVIEAVMFRGPSSRAYRRLVIDEHAAVEVSGGYEAHRGPSVFGLYAVVPQGGDLGRVSALYAEELARLRAEPLAPLVLEKVRNQLRAGHVLSQESALQRALSLGRATLFYGDPGWEDRYLDGIARVTAADVLRVAAAGLHADNTVELRILPR